MRDALGQCRHLNERRWRLISALAEGAEETPETKCCFVWVCDLLYGLFPENPEGVGEAVRKLVKRLLLGCRGAVEGKVVVLTVVDADLVSATDPTGPGPPVGVSVTSGRLENPSEGWFCLRGYNLATLYKSRAEALKACDQARRR